MLSFVRTVVLVCLGLSLLSGTRVSGTRLNADMWVTSQHGHASGTRSNAVPRTPAVRGWQLFIYGGVSVPSGIGRAPAPSGYSLAYPPAWSSKLWPDSLATYGQLDLQSPGGTGISLVLLPLRPHGPTLSAIIARDKAVLSNTRQDSVPLPLGPALRIAGRHKPATSGLMTQILYLERRQVVYRLFATRPMGATGPNLLLQIAATLRLTDNHGPSSPSRPPVPQPGAETCCHCPAWGAGWGVPLTSLDGVTAYGNGGTTDNGCNGTYGIMYQCVELVQRYFARRWGYPSIWSDVEAAVDMRTHHPEGITFIPNGGAAAPQAGDALLFNGGTYGHVAVVKIVDRHAGRITFIEENWTRAGEARLPLYTDNTVGLRDSVTTSYAVAGWLHSERNVAAAPSAT